MMNEKVWLLYVHTNKVNNKKYVGITSVTPSIRWGSTGIGYKGQKFYNAIKKYEWDNFEHEIIVRGLTKDEADYWERLYIKELNTRLPNGYNVTEGGDATTMDKSHLVGENASNIKPLICLTTLEIFPYQKLAIDKYGIFNAALSGCINGKGRNYAGKDENGNKLMWSHYYPELDMDYYIKLRNEISERIKNHGNIGRKKSKESLKSISKPVICLETKQYYCSSKDAMRKIGANNTSITKCCKGTANYAGRHPDSGEPLHWMYYDDYLKTNKEEEVI